MADTIDPLSPSHFVGAQVYTIEPDLYAERQVLDNISPLVTLSTGAFSDHRPTFNVTAITDAPGATTGAKVFAHAGGIPFWNRDRVFRMDFHVPVVSISIDYKTSGVLSSPYSGRLEAYGDDGTLLSSYTTALLPAGTAETMTVSANSIAYALAYPPDNPFGDLDHLVFSVPVPEPTTFALAAFGALGLLIAARRKR